MRASAARRPHPVSLAHNTATPPDAPRPCRADSADPRLSSHAGRPWLAKRVCKVVGTSRIGRDWTRAFRPAKVGTGPPKWPQASRKSWTGHLPTTLHAFCSHHARDVVQFAF